MSYQKLFENSRINGMTLPNRFVMAPMTTMSNTEFAVDDKLTDYYEARAKGGTGLLILEAQVVTNKLEPFFASSIHTGTPIQRRQWEAFNMRVKGYGAKTCVQLTCGSGRNAGGEVAISASEVPIFGNPDATARALTVDEIQLIVQSFGEMAALAKESGFDAIEIHGHTGYLLDQFMSACWNKRTDAYGGSLENRMRLPREIVAAVRNSVGPDFPILFRLSVEHKFPGGREVADGLEIAKALNDSGIDAFDIDDGSYEAMEWVFPPTYLGDAPLLANAAKVKEVTSLPVMVTGNFTPETAADAVNSGKVDYILLGRGLIADPDFVNKLRQGKQDEIRPCIRCNEYCIGRAGVGMNVQCSINMQAGNEKTFPAVKTADPKKVVVVGGGPGGLEAARVAAEAGHSVALYEANSYLGGQIAAAATPVFKKPLKDYLKYLIKQVEKLNVTVYLNHEINVDSPELVDADEIIAAVGATPIALNIPGSDKDNVYEILDAHMNGIPEDSQNVAIAGGGLSGCDYALGLAMNGKNVTIIEMLDDVAVNAQFLNKMALMKKMAEYDINIMTGHRVLEFTDDSVITENKDGAKAVIPADCIITAFGTKPRKEFVDEILDKYPRTKCIGDCTSVAQVGEAVRAAYLAAWTL